VFFSEIEKFPSAVLQHHYPHVPNYGDMTNFKEWPDDQSISLLVGGTPCQSFSVAGLRKGLADPRGNLMLTFLAVAKKYNPQWIVWENVPGVLSSNKGRDFGTFLSALGKCGYGFAYRVLDAQYFGVAQRRRRVFVVGYLGDWRRAAAVLFERESLSGHPAPSRQTRERIADTITVGANQYSRFIGEPVEVASVVGPLTAGMHKGPRGTEAVESNHVIAYDMKQHHNPQPTDTMALTAGNCNTVRGDTPLIAFASEMSGTQAASTPEVSPTLSVGHTTAVASELKVRRLTPCETERLQGFPDNYTQIPWRNKASEDCPDGPRYKAMGNSMAVPVMRWIGERIDLVRTL
jgi:DNA (cytosine-5)-methyltransferase 1